MAAPGKPGCSSGVLGSELCRGGDSRLPATCKMCRAAVVIVLKFESNSTYVRCDMESNFLEWVWTEKSCFSAFPDMNLRKPGKQKSTQASFRPTLHNVVAKYVLPCHLGRRVLLSAIFFDGVVGIVGRLLIKLHRSSEKDTLNSKGFYSGNEQGRGHCESIACCELPWLEFRSCTTAGLLETSPSFGTQWPETTCISRVKINGTGAVLLSVDNLIFRGFHRISSVSVSFIVVLVVLCPRVSRRLARSLSVR